MTPAERRARLAALVARVADDLEGRGFAGAPIIRQAAIELATTPAPPAPGACPQCGGKVTQPARGRRRDYCSPRCRDRARREKTA